MFPEVSTVYIAEKKIYHVIGAFEILFSAKQPAGPLSLYGVRGSRVGSGLGDKYRNDGDKDVGKLHSWLCFAKYTTWRTDQVQVIQGKTK